MKKLSLLVLTAVVFSGCMGAGEPEKSPEEMVKEAMTNGQKVESSDYSITAEGAIKNPELEEDVEFKVDLSGAFTMVDPKNPQFSFIIDTVGKLNTTEGPGEEQNMKAELRLVGNNVYAVLNEVSDFDGQLPMAMVTPYLKQWWSIPVPPEEIEKIGMYKWTEEPTDPKAKALKELYEKTMLFKDLKYEGSEDGNYVYSWVLDEEALVVYLTEANKIAETQDYDIAAVEESLAFIEVDGKLMIDEKDIMMNGMEGTIELQEKAEGEPSGTIDFAYTISNVNGDVKIEAPADAKEFDPMQLLGGAMMMDPAAMEELKVMPEVSEDDMMMVDPTMMEGL